jgi:hypothetical protein
MGHWLGIPWSQFSKISQVMPGEEIDRHTCRLPPAQIFAGLKLKTENLKLLRELTGTARRSYRSQPKGGP